MWEMKTARRQNQKNPLSAGKMACSWVHHGRHAGSYSLYSDNHNFDLWTSEDFSVHSGL